MAVSWTNNLITGLAWQDNEHKSLFECMDGLLESMSSKQANEEVQFAMEFLKEYTDKHFKREEDWMVETVFPDYDLHLSAHREFKKTMFNLEKDLQDGMDVDKLILTVQKYLINWFKNHIGTLDKKLGDHILGL